MPFEATGLVRARGLGLVRGRTGLISSRTRTVIAAAIFALIGLPAAAADAPAGLWYDHTGRGAVEIAPCGRNMCGFIVWLKDVRDKEGRELKDIYNPDPAKRNATICGLQVIGGMKKQNDGSWDDGWIYDPEKGEAFDLELRSLSADTLQVVGYKGLKFLSETHKWQRVSTLPSPRCGK